DAAFSLLYGCFKTAFHELDRSLSGIGSPYAAVHNSFRQTAAITDLQLGLRWDHMFSKDRYHFGIQAGWEHHMFFSQNQLTHFVDDAEIGNFVLNQGDLTTQGWTLSARFDF
ncbi:MAG TPA: Lpg1974 family pore-forming outer membrane protein, partial [Aquirhabdus sp.]